MNSKNRISISSFNVKGLRGNLIYSKFLPQISNICFFSELWTRPNEIDMIKDLANFSNKSFIYKSDIDHTYTKGRPFGGQCWVLDKMIKLIEHRFINRHISYVHVNVEGLEIVVLGVYMPFNNSKKSNESKSMFELVLSIIISIVHEFKSRNLPDILTGDFNADFNRNNRFDIILKNFIKDHDFILLDNLNSQNSYTYKSSFINNTHTTVNIDHFILCGPTIPTSFTNPNFAIHEDISNLSDHNPIILSFFIPINLSVKTSVTPKTIKKNINFYDVKMSEFFNQRVESRIYESFNPIIASNFQISLVNQDEINLIYNQISHLYVLVSEEAIMVK